MTTIHATYGRMRTHTHTHRPRPPAIETVGSEIESGEPRRHRRTHERDYSRRSPINGPPPSDPRSVHGLGGGTREPDHGSLKLNAIESLFAPGVTMPTSRGRSNRRAYTSSRGTSRHRSLHAPARNKQHQCCRMNVRCLGLVAGLRCQTPVRNDKPIGGLPLHVPGCYNVNGAPRPPRDHRSRCEPSSNQQATNNVLANSCR